MEVARMSYTFCARFALLLAVAICSPAIALGEALNSRLATYSQDGQSYFALSLLSQTTADPAQKNDVVILVDTSASQVGRYRADELAAVQAVLSGLLPTDRVQLMAVDMKATPLSSGFVAPQGPEMQAALAKLNGRTPLGATDLEAGLRTAAAALAPEGSARTVIYVGDAMSKANVLNDA